VAGGFSDKTGIGLQIDKILLAKTLSSRLAQKYCHIVISCRVFYRRFGVLSVLFRRECGFLKNPRL